MFPAVVATAENAITATGTAHTMAVPAGTVATDLVLICSNIGSTASSMNPLTGWTELLDENIANGLKIWYYSGTGVPSNPAFVAFTSTRFSSISFRISGADKSIAPTIAGTTSSGSSTTPDPPASATPSEERDYLVIALFGCGNEELDDDTWVNTGPTDFLPAVPLQKASGTGGVNLGGNIGASYRQLRTGAAVDPGAFAMDVSAPWRAQTILIPGLKTVTSPVMAPRISA